MRHTKYYNSHVKCKYAKLYINIVTEKIMNNYPGLGRLSQAEEYLSQARWTVLKTPDCDAAIKSKMYRICGLLQAAKGNFSEALKNYANDVSFNFPIESVWVTMGSLNFVFLSGNDL